MKKLTRSLLTVALLFTAVGTFYSCKDNDGDINIGQKAQVYALQDQINVLQNTLVNLQAQHNNLQTQQSALQALVGGQAGDIATNSAAIKALQTALGNNTAGITQLQNAIANLQTVSGNNNAAIVQLQTAIANLQNALNGDPSDPTNPGLVTIVNNYTTNFNNQISNINSQLTTIGNAVNTANQAASDAAAAAAASDALAKEALAAAQNAQSVASSALAQAQANGQNITTLQNLYNTLNGNVTTLQTTVGTLSTDVSSLKSTIAAWGPQLTTAYQNAADALALAQANQQQIKVDSAVLAGRIDTAEGNIANLQSDLTAVDNRLKTAENEIGSLKTAVAEAKDIANTATALANKALAKCDSLGIEITNMKDLYATLDSAYKAADKTLGERIDSLNEKVETYFAALKNRFNHALDNMITGIILNGSNCPALGYAALPVGVKSNVLAMYKGKALVDTYFPTTSTAGYIWPEQALTAEEFAALGTIDGRFHVANGAILPDYENGGADPAALGNLGKLYLTVNPVSRDFTGVDFSLINSQGEVAPVALSSIKKSDDVLTFGWTRADAPYTNTNILYEAEATLDPNNFSKVAPNIDLNEIKDAIKNVTSIEKLRDRNNIANLAQTLLDNMSGVLPAYAVQTKWTDSLGEHRVISDYGIAATAVKPLSFSFAKDLNVKTVPGYERAYSYIDKLINKFNLRFNFKGNIVAPTIKNIDIVPFDSLNKKWFKQTVSIDTTIVVANKTYSIDVVGQEIVVKDVNGNVIGSTITPNIHKEINTEKQEIKIWVTRTIDLETAVKELYDNITGPLADVNKMIDEISKFMSDVQSILDEVNTINAKIDGVKNDIRTELVRVLNAVNSRLCNVINSTNKTLQPVLLTSTSKGTRLVSRASKYPTRVPAGTISLLPTTFTYEMLAPAYKKHVAVVQVNGSTEGVAAANTGKNLNKVFDGKTVKCELNVESGKTYKIVFSAMDYSGKIVTRRYYIQGE